MATVFIPQVPSRFDSGLKKWVPTISINPAATWGTPLVLLPPEAYRLDIEQLMPTLNDAMRKFTEDDYLLATGDPTIFAVAAVLAARQADGLLRMLRWDRQSSSYNLVEIQT